MGDGGEVRGEAMRELNGETMRQVELKLECGGGGESRDAGGGREGRRGGGKMKRMEEEPRMKIAVAVGIVADGQNAT